MQKYLTNSGDTFDLVAYKIFGSSRYLPELISANRELIATFVFSAGVEIVVPEISAESKIKTPPWKG